MSLTRLPAEILPWSCGTKLLRLHDDEQLSACALYRHNWSSASACVAAQHRAFEGFSAKYCAKRLVWFERYQYVKNAIAREKQLKNWSRHKKIALIATMNPAFR